MLEPATLRFLNDAPHLIWQVPLFFLMMGVVLFAGILFYTEKGGARAEDFKDMWHASWFVIVTLSTVGYGDVVPATPAGQAITYAAQGSNPGVAGPRQVCLLTRLSLALNRAVIILCGVLFMAMPITIVGNSFAQVWEEKEAIKVVLKMQELLLMRDLQVRRQWQ